ncbi:MAG: hypothetical protein P8P74_08345 [Crocinitomicaceae bacterium]|nr:hypothetical protein [Crocinitomicaceae bacterium]
MKISVFKSILIGLLVGLLVVVATRLVIILLIVGAIFRLSGRGKWRRKQWKEKRMAFVDKVRGMDDEEFKNFKENFEGNHGCHSNYNMKNA